MDIEKTAVYLDKVGNEVSEEAYTEALEQRPVRARFGLGIDAGEHSPMWYSMILLPGRW